MNIPLTPTIKKSGRLIAILLLLLFFARLLHTESLKSITYDEPPHVLNAIQYFQPQPMVSTINNPPLIHALMGALIHLIGLHYDMGYENDVWTWGDGFDIAQIFFWQSNTNWPQLFWAGRLMIIFLALFLASLLFRWAGQLYHDILPALFVLLLLTFDPNILGFSYLATADLGIAAFFTLAGYSLWRYWQKPTGGKLFAAGLAVGLAIGAKFSGAAIIPALLLMVLYRWALLDRSKTGVVQAIKTTTLILAVAFFAFLIIYRFQIPLILADFQFQQAHFREGHEAYLLGEISRTGWWYYYPVLFFAKTPSGLLALLLMAGGLFLWSRQYRWEYVWLLLLSGTLFATTLGGSVNIGYRYLLPVLPPLFVFLGQLALPQTSRRWRLLTAVALLSFLSASVRIHPHYLSFFNALVGGAENGWQVAVDSNIDWGQDLEALGRYLAERGIEDAHISWFSTAMPKRYGIPGTSFLTWPPSHRDLVMDDLYLERPLPGLYAISATQLAGPYLHDEADSMVWFRQRQPDYKVGYSYFIYEVTPEGIPAGLALSGIGVAMIEPDNLALVSDGNNIRLRHFDARTSFVWPGGGEEKAWTAVGDGHFPTHPFLQSLYSGHNLPLTGERLVADVLWRYHLYEWPMSPLQPTVLAPDTVLFDQTLQFLGVEMAEEEGEAGRPLSLLTFWRVKQIPNRDLKLFVHVQDQTGALIAQHDGLDIQTATLQPGDEFAQLHTLPLPSGLPPGTYTLQLGVYDAATLTRLSLPPGSLPSDHLPLPLVIGN